MSQTRASLLLFDIDGTLLLSGGAGLRAMTRVFEEMFGVHEAFAGSDVAGRTDTFIVENALRAAGVTADAEARGRFRRRYAAVLGEEIAAPATGRYGVMPGVFALLTALRAQPAAHLALLTGNFETAARIKLDHFGIGDYFPWGVFGEESAERDELARVAVRRAADHSLPSGAREQVTIVGDTPHDITCARVIGARVLAVATGNYSAADLTAAGADVVLPDLSDTARVLEILDEAS